MSSFAPSKKRHNQNSKESNGKRSFKSSSHNSQKRPRKGSLESAVFRILCPSSKIGSVIGNDGNIISEICQETGAKVRVDDPVPGCDERVIVVTIPDNETGSSSEHLKADKEESRSTKEQDGSEDQDKNDAEKDSFPSAENSYNETGTSSVQTALLLLSEKFLEREKMTNDDNNENSGYAAVTLRLLVLSSQVGCLLGKGGFVIKQMSADSGAQIRVLPRDKLPQCASSADDVVQITGAADAVKKAVKSVSDQILKNPPHDHDSFPSKPSGPLSHSQSHLFPRPESHQSRLVPPQGPLGGGFRDSGDFHSNVPSLYPKFHENFIPSRMDVPDILTFRLLCPDERAGGVIGKGGAIIKTLQHETGCEIRVLEGTSNGEERIVIVSGPAHPDDRISLVQDAVLRVQHRIAKAVPDSKEKGVTAKLLVSSNQIGCLLGKGGSIIAEMRKVTGAYIRILGKDQIPKCASENEEVVQINGELEIVQEAVLQITTRLRHHFFRDAFPPINYPSHPAFSDRAPPLPSFIGRRELSPSGMFPKLGPSRSFDSMGGPPVHGVFHPHDDHPLFMNDIHRQEISHISGRPWHPQTSMEGGRMGMDYAGPPQRLMSGFGGESQQAVITNTTVEVVVPSSLVPSIYGENGGCLKQIRQISEAKITIVDPKPGAYETMVVISGTPEQTHAAQSLIQAFVMIENESS